MRHRAYQASFASGVFSRALFGRSDLDKWPAALARCINMIPLPEGPVTRRPGSIYVTAPKDASTSACRLIAFRFSLTQDFILAFTDLTMRVYTKSGVVMDGMSPYELTTPYTSAQVASIDVCQSKDRVYIVHPDHAPRVLLRNSDTDWELNELKIIDGPYTTTNSTTKTFTIVGSAPTFTLTASSATFTADDVGRLVRIRQNSSSDWAYGEITAHISDTEVTVSTANSEYPLGATTATTEWALGAWNSFRGWPSKVAIYEQRLVFGRNAAAPDIVWFSTSFGYNNESVYMDPTTRSGAVDDSEGFDRALNADGKQGELNSIEWLSAGKVLSIGTESREWLIQASNSQSGFGPLNAKATTSSSRGSIRDVVPVSIDGYVLFAERGGKGLREFSYSLDRDAYDAKLASLFVKEYFYGEGAGQIQAMTYCQAPDSVIWVAMSDGRLLSYTYEPSQRIGAWAEHRLGGTYQSGLPVIESMAVLYDEEKGYDQLWMVVKRTINGSDTRYIEYLAPNYLYTQDLTQAHFVDAAGVYSGVATTTQTGLDHLEGEEVRISVNGARAYATDVEVVSGQVEVTPEATMIRTGFGYTSEIETLDVDAGSKLGSARFARKRSISPVLYVVNSQHFKVGFRKLDTDVVETANIPERSVSDAMDAAVPARTEPVAIPSPQPYQRVSSIVISTDGPGALTLGAIRYGDEINED